MITDPGAARVAGFLFVALALIIASDYESTAPIAVAFAYLILISALAARGERAFTNIAHLFPQTTTKG